MSIVSASIHPDAFDRAVVESVARLLLDIRSVVVEGRRYPAHVERVGDTVKFLVDGHAYDVAVARGLLHDGR